MEPPFFNVVLQLIHVLKPAYHLSPYVGHFTSGSRFYCLQANQSVKNIEYLSYAPRANCFLLRSPRRVRESMGSGNEKEGGSEMRTFYNQTRFIWV